MPNNVNKGTVLGCYITTNSLYSTIRYYSYDRHQTYDFTLGEKQVITGVELGLMNMCEGERRKLTIPPILAYGKGGYGKINPDNHTNQHSPRNLGVIRFW